MRLTPFKNTHLTDAEVKITVGIQFEENNSVTNKFYFLDLEMSYINSLNLSWTLVHPITESSPFYGFTENDFKITKGEIMVYLKAFDDMFSNTVVKRTSYTLDEVVYGAKFDLMYTRSQDDTKTILHVDKLNSFVKVEL